ncbi:type VII secretion-associated serine protease mycosin [Plantactinospora soyae]|uniref:Type VII secretion-associated serine protease mycosin n=1 Tax=Plantactinospora soyae TaxID=1544732 RepID=A0A927M5T4_9ACTN|nr:type VII secretion-associated serine protease mycosin [Plantactinospora soyae]MBE1488703.1 type VII secretion-associated serine protease mycosin [Plantactinospora soyae]
MRARRRGHGTWLPRWCAAAACGVLAVLVGAPPAFADAARDRQWHLRSLNIAEAHRITQGAGVVVAVIDTGVRASHRDLVDNVLPGVDLTGEGGNGQQDANGHGTAMAGLIAAHGHGPGNADGALGIAPKAKILPIRDSKSSVGSGGILPTAIDQAVQRGAKVISMSLSGGTFDRLRESVDKALAADVVLVAAAGNRPDNRSVGYPAAYPGVLAVGASARDGKLARVSVTGEAVGLIAPGEDIATTSRTGEYRSATGTSDSTAIVAGAAALVRAKYPDLSATEVVHRLTATATDQGSPGRDPEYGYGVLNLVKALTADVKPAESAPSPDGSAPAEDPSEPAAAPPDTEASPGITLSPVAYVVGGSCLLLVLAGVGVLVWLLVRSGRRRRGPPGQPTVPGPAPGSYPAAQTARPPGSGYPAPTGYPPAGYPATPHQPPPGYGQPGQPRPPTHPGGPSPGG